MAKSSQEGNFYENSVYNIILRGWEEINRTCLTITSWGNANFQSTCPKILKLGTQTVSTTFFLTRSLSKSSGVKKVIKHDHQNLRFLRLSFWKLIAPWRSHILWQVTGYLKSTMKLQWRHYWYRCKDIDEINQMISRNATNG